MSCSCFVVSFARIASPSRTTTTTEPEQRRQMRRKGEKDGEKDWVTLAREGPRVTSNLAHIISLDSTPVPFLSHAPLFFSLPPRSLHSFFYSDHRLPRLCSSLFTAIIATGSALIYLHPRAR